MSIRNSSYRFVIVAVAVIALVSALTATATTSAASPWSAALEFLGLSSTNNSTAVTAETTARNSTEPLFAPGCDTAGPIEVEGSILGTTPTAYATLGAAFTAINLGTHTGAVTIEVCGNTTEPGTATIKAGTVAPASWTSLSMVPAGGAARTITGSAPNGSPLIYMDGVDGMMINGLNSGGNSLTISNTNNNGSAGTATVLFVDGATGNTITNSTILGSFSGGTGVAGGVIHFSTDSSVGPTGNDNNTISNNNIGPAGANLPTTGIYSAGTSAAVDNSGITISGNNISDYFSATLVTAGIHLAATGNSGWTIQNNRLFQSATRVYTSAQTHNGIFIGVGSGYTVSGNILGFANSAGTGTTNLVGNSVALTGTFPSAYTTTGTANATRYVAINAAFTAGGAASSIQGNTVAGYALFTSSGSTTTNGIFCGINVTSGNANIGTTTANTIGATTGQGSIYAANTSGGGVVVGIYATSTNTVTIQNNTIGAIDSVGTTTSLSGAFTGIDTAGSGGVFNISSNTLGNSSTDNIRTGYTLSGANLSNAGTLTSTTGTTSPMVGIRNSASGTTLSITSNTLRGWVNGTTAGGALTGITSTGANTTSVAINTNLLGTSGLGWVRYAFANAGTVAGIVLSGATAAQTQSIQSNDFQGIVYAVAGSGSHTYINQTSATGTGITSTISSNTFTNLNVNTTGSVTFISQSYTASATSTKNTNSNSIVTAFAKPSAGGTVTFVVDNGSTVSGAQSNCLNNNFSNGTLTGATNITGISYTDGGSAPTRTVTGNILNNWTTGAATVNMMNFTYWNGTSSLSTNTITNIAGQGGITGLTMGSTVSTATSITVSGNTFSGFSSTGTGGSVLGINNTNTSTLISFTSNTFSNFSSTAASVAAILNNGATAVNITANTINTLSSTNASAAVNAINIGAGTTVGISKNKIYDISGSTAAAVVNGINLTAGTTFNVSNNLIGDLRAPAATGLDAVRGINAAATSTYNVFHNTIYLNATSTSVTTFGNSAVTFSSSATTFNLRNNILVNLSTPAQNGSNIATNGIAATLRRTSGTAAVVPTNYNTASNNNDFWVNPTAGTNNHATYVEGTATITNNMNTFAQMKTFMVNRDQASFGEDTTAPQKFLSTTGSNATFLHIDPTVATQIESGGGTGTGIADDFDNQARSGTTPDVGADEFAGIGIDLTGPAIGYTALGNTSCTADRTLSATITDGTGVNTTPGTKPRLYYRRSAGPNADTNTFNDNTSGTAGWKYVEASNASSPFSFTTNFALLNGGGGIAATNVVEYFVVAQDTAGTPNVGINAGAFTTNPTSVALVAGNFPFTGAPSFTVVAAGLSGTVTIGATGTYPNLTGATGLFNAINTNGLSGSLTANIVDASVGEAGTVALNAINYNGCAAGPYPVLIKPAASTVSTLTGSVGAGAIIKLNGADSVTIDGSNAGASDRSLTIENTTTTTSGNAVVWLASPALGNGALSNTIKNTIIQGNASTTTQMGLYVGGSTTVGTAAAGLEVNSGNTISNNLFRKSQYGLYIFGYGAATPDVGNVVSNNAIGTSVAGEGFSVEGLHAERQQNLTVSGNDVQNVTGAGLTNMYGIRLLDFKTGSAFNNKVHDVSYTGTSTTKNFGLAVVDTTYTTVGNPANSLIYNNSIYKINSTGTSAVWNTTGLLVSASYGDKFYFNSVSMTGAVANSASGLSAAFANGDGTITTPGSNLDIRNNVFSQTGSSATAGGNFWAFYTAATTLTGTTLNYNDEYCNGTGATNNVGRFNSVNYTTLAAWQGATGQEANSISADALFTSTSDLRPQLGSPLLLKALSLAPTVTTDLLGVTRSVGAPPTAGPTIGAYEGAVDVVGPTITYTAFSNTNNTSNRTLTISVTDASGVPTTGIGLPRIYFRKGVSDPWTANSQCVFVSGSSYTCDIDYAQVTGGSVTIGDTVQYYVVAQDNLNNVSANPSTGAGAFTANPPAAGTPPTTPNSYQIVGPPLNGDYLVPGAYATLTAAVADYNARGVSGPTRFLLATTGTYSAGETFPLIIATSGPDTTATNTLTIQPNTGVTATISGVSTSGIIVIGDQYVKIDGDNVGGDVARNLTIQNTGTGTNSYVVGLFNFGGTKVARNATIRYSNIQGGATVVTTTGWGIIANGTGGDYDNLLIDNNKIWQAYTGIGHYGVASTGVNNNGVISNNVIGDAASSNSSIKFNGIDVSQSDGLSITGNDIFGYAPGNSNATQHGVFLGTGSSNNSVTRNNIHDFYYTGTGGLGSYGVIVNANAGTTTIANNFIHEIKGDGDVFNTATNIFWMPAGITISGTNSGTLNIDHNSIYMSGATLGTTFTGNSACVSAIAGITGVNLRNNVLRNSMTGTTSNKTYAVATLSAGTAAMFGTINNNDYFVNGTGPNVGALTASDRTTLANWQSATGSDGASLAVDPQMTSISNLHLSNPANAVVGAGAAGLAAVDYDNDPRPALAPDIGADEIVQAQGGLIAGGTYYNAAFANGNTLTGNVSITNTLYLAGITNGSTFTTSLGCNATVSGAGPTNFIIGTVAKQYCVNTPTFTYPVGTGTQYSPMIATNVLVNINPSTLSVQAIIGAIPGTNSQEKVDRNWNVTETGDLVADMLFDYDFADVTTVSNNEAGFDVLRKEGNSDVAVVSGGTIDTGAHNAMITGVSMFSRWGVGKVLAPTAANASLSGRIVTADGRGITNARVVLTGNTLNEPMVVLAGPMGYYRFDNLEAGETYVVTVISKRFTFQTPSRIVTINESVDNWDFIADPQQ